MTGKEKKYNFFYYTIRIYEKKALIFVSTNNKTTTIMKALDFFYDLFFVNVTTGKEVRAETVYGKEPALALAKEFNEENAGHPVKAIVKINPSHK